MFKNSPSDDDDDDDKTLLLFNIKSTKPSNINSPRRINYSCVYSLLLYIFSIILI